MVRRHVPENTGKWLERVTGKKQRATEYWLQGTYQPRGDDALKIAAALRRELDALSARLQQFELDFTHDLNR